jgi:hypothetical protein
MFGPILRSKLLASSCNNIDDERLGKTYELNLPAYSLLLKLYGCVLVSKSWLQNGFSNDRHA